MNAQSKKGNWLAVLLGAVAGAVLTGAPLIFYSSDLRARLATETSANATLAAANRSLDLARAKLQADFDTLQSDSEAKTAELVAEQQRSKELEKPDLPLQLTFRRGLVAHGMVLTIKNASGADLSVNAQFKGNGVQSKLFRLLLPANLSRDFGELEGWAFSPGDIVSLTNPDYRPITRAVPQS